MLQKKNIGGMGVYSIWGIGAWGGGIDMLTLEKETTVRVVSFIPNMIY